MDVYFVPYEVESISLKGIEKLVKVLKGKVGVVWTINYNRIAKIIVNVLRKNKIKAVTEVSKKTGKKGVILGCDVSAAEKIKNIVDTFLFIGDGKFHPLEIVRKTRKDVIIYNPITGYLEVLNESCLEEFYRDIKIIRRNYLFSEKIGVVISVKPGQFSEKLLKSVKDKVLNDQKEIFLFLANNINFDEMLNFSDIQFWVIIACPRILDDILKRKIKNVVTYDVFLNSF